MYIWRVEALKGELRAGPMPARRVLPYILAWGILLAMAAPLPLFLPLPAGDTGVRTVTDTTLGATGTATGEYHLSIVRPLALIQIPTTAQYVERDFVNELPILPRIYDDSCLVVYFLSGTASGSFTIFGEVGICEN